MKPFCNLFWDDPRDADAVTLFNSQTSICDFFFWDCARSLHKEVSSITVDNIGLHVV